MNAKYMIIYTILIMTVLLYGCSQAQPTDSQVISDLNLNKEGLIDAYCVKGKTGHQYWHTSDKTWYWERGVVIKRKAGISGAPDAVVIISGLARYHTDGNKYSYYKFLTSDNQYEGIPAPSGSDLVAFVKRELQNVFIGRAHNIMEVSSVELIQDAPWEWHNAGSFTAKFLITYKMLISYTEVAQRVGQYDIRFYRENIDSPIHSLMSTETSYEVKEVKKYTNTEISQMKSLAQQ